MTNTPDAATLHPHRVPCGIRGPHPWAAPVAWTCQVIVALILLQTLFFKFTGAPESRYIFETLGMEPWGRWASGVAELCAALLLLLPRTAPLGAALALGVISGAIISHLTKLGIVVQNDGGLLFALALIVFLGSAITLLIRRRQLPILGPRITAFELARQR